MNDMRKLLLPATLLLAFVSANAQSEDDIFIMDGSGRDNSQSEIRRAVSVEGRSRVLHRSGREPDDFVARLSETVCYPVVYAGRFRERARLLLCRRYRVRQPTAVEDEGTGCVGPIPGKVQNGWRLLQNGVWTSGPTLLLLAGYPYPGEAQLLTIVVLQEGRATLAYNGHGEIDELWNRPLRMRLITDYLEAI